MLLSFVTVVVVVVVVVAVIILVASKQTAASFVSNTSPFPGTDASCHAK